VRSASEGASPGLAFGAGAVALVGHFFSGLAVRSRSRELNQPFSSKSGRRVIVGALALGGLSADYRCGFAAAVAQRGSIAIERS